MKKLLVLVGLGVLALMPAIVRARSLSITPPYNSITIVKEAPPADGTDFAFTLDSPATTQYSFDTTFGIPETLGGLSSSFPSGVGVDGAGNVYVADDTNGHIHKFDSSGTLLLTWGTNGLYMPGRFWSIRDIGVSATGDVYVADFVNQRIQKFDSNGTYLTEWYLLQPYGIGVDSAGYVYTTSGGDSSNPRVKKFDSNGTLILEWGSLGDYTGQFMYPTDVAVDSVGNVYVTDWYNQRVQKFDSSGTFLRMWGWGVATGANAFEVCTIACGPGYDSFGNGGFSQPWGIMVDSSDYIYVADSYNNRIQRFDSNGAFLDKWGVSGSGTGQFNLPRNIAVDSAGNFYVADADNQRMQKFDSSYAYLDQWAIDGYYDGWLGKSFTEDRAEGITTNQMGQVLVADTYNHRVQVFDHAGNYLNQWGINGSGNGQFDLPQGIAVDSGGKVYVTDAGNHRVQLFDSSGAYVTKWGRVGTSEGEFSNPHGIAVDDAGNVYVMDAGNYRVQMFDSGGTFVRMWGWGVADGSSMLQVCTVGCQAGMAGSGNGQLNSASWLVVDDTGRVYVADGSRVQMFDTSGAYINQWAASATIEGIEIDNAGILYVSVRNAIQLFSSEGAYLTQWSSGTYLTNDLAIASTGNLYVFTELPGTIQKYMPDLTNFILDDVMPDDGDGIVDTQTFTNLFAGTYTVSESATDGWVLDAISCTTTDSGDVPVVVGDEVQINLDTTEHVTCTFTNICAPVVAVASTMGISGSDVVVTWTHDPDNVNGYEIHRGMAPYFTPNAGTLISTVSAGIETYNDTGSLGNASTNYYYVVRSLNCAGTQTANSNRMAEFDFALVR